MIDSRTKISNRQILGQHTSQTKSQEALDLISIISVNRPLHNRDEASAAIDTVNCLMAFVNRGIWPDDGSFDSSERAIYGMHAVLEACQLVSLRVEQYIDLLPDEVRR